MKRGNTLGHALILALAATLVLGAAACKKSAPKASDEAAKKVDPATAPKTKGEPPAKVPPGAAPENKEQVAASHILVAFKGAMRANPEITRTKEEAKAEIAKVLVEVRKDTTKFAELAKKHSDAPDKERGGDLGVIPSGLGNHPFAVATKDLKVGDVSEPVETPFGWHILMRKAPPAQYAGAHILVAYKGAMRAKPDITRSKEEAQKKATELAEKLNKDASTFAELAKTNSDGPSGPKGGSLGKWFKGMMVPEFDTAIEGLKIGEVSAPVETPFGFHVIKREDPAKMP